MAPQAEERHRLSQQIIGHRAVRIVTMRATLRNRRMLVHERPLLFCMALVAHAVYRIFFEVSFGLAVRVVAIGASHLAFPDRMMRRQGGESVDRRVAPVARLWFVDAHRQAFGTSDRGVTDVHYLRHLGLGVRIVAIRAGHPILFVDGRVPRHRRRTVMALETDVFSCFREDLPVGTVTGVAIEAVGPKKLMGMSNLLELTHFGMAAIARLRLVDRHRGPCLRVGIMAICAGDSRHVVRGPLPLLHVRAVMACQTKVFPCFRPDVSMCVVASRALELRGMVLDRLRCPTGRRIMAGRATEVEWHAKLMGMDDVLESAHVGVTPIANIWGNRSQAVRLPVRHSLDDLGDFSDQADRAGVLMRVHSGRFINRWGA
jgi:hypothetical protein